MRNFFGRFLLQIRNALSRGYGFDQLSIPLVVVSCIFTLLSSLTRLSWLRMIGTLILLWAIFRIFSKNDSARQKELQLYLTLKQKITGPILLIKEIYQNRKTKKYFKCPNCKAYLFVPKGKGKIRITCRKCGHQFIKKT